MRHTLKRVSLAAAERKVARAERRYVQQDPCKLGIELMIRSVVIALVAHGFPTQNSCEGHLDQYLYPWVRLQPRTTSNSKKSLLRHLAQIHSETAQLTELLHGFWEQRPQQTPDRVLMVAPEWDLSKQSDEEIADEYIAERAKHFVALPGYMLQCAGAKALTTMPSEIIGPYRLKILENRQTDMLDFGKYLVSQL